MKTCSPPEESPAAAARSPESEFAVSSCAARQASKSALTLDNHQEGHMGVLPAAEFCALASIPARASGSERQYVVLAGDQVLLAAEVGHPKAMDDVRCLEIDLDRTADGHVELVGGVEDL